MGVVFRSEPCVSVEEMSRNAAHTRTLGFPSVEYAGDVAVVGGGPSLADHLDELRACKGPIWAINATWQWLKERGVKATFFTVDPKPQAWLKLEPGESALVATVGSAELFASLSAGYVRTFDLGMNDVNCGVTSATAAPHLAIKMGHASVTFFGCDSSFKGFESHVYPVDLPDDLMVVGVGERGFATKPEFVMQAEDLAALCRELPTVCKNRSDGLMAAMIENPEWDVVGVKERA
jgi:hypothetical protein